MPSAIPKAAEPAPRPASREVLARIPQIAIPLIALLAVIVLTAHARDRANDRGVGAQRNAGIATLQTAIVARELEWAVFTIRGLAEAPLVVQYLSGEDHHGELEREFAHFCSVSRIFDQMRLIGEGGQEAVRVNFDGNTARAVRPEQLQQKAGRYYVERAWDLDRGGVYISPFDLNVEHGVVETPHKPVIRIASPCFDASGQKRGLLVLNYLGADLLSRLRASASPEPEWSALVNDEGYFLAAPRGSVSWGFQTDAAPTFRADHPDAWAQLSAEEAGTFRDEQGLYAFRRIATGTDPLDSGARIDLGLRVVVFTPTEVLYGPSRSKFRRMLVVGALFVIAIVAASWRLAYVGAVRARDQQRLADSEARLRRLSARLLDATEDERRRLSRDLHDDLGQLATVLSIDLGRAASVADPETRNDILRHARAGAEELLGAVRRVAASLRDTAVDDLGLDGALRAMIADLEERTPLRVETDFAIGETEVPPPIGVHVYRIVQESLSNVLRHSGAERARLRIDLDRTNVTVVVEDEGVGFDDAPSEGGIGLLGMRERVELLRGRLHISTASGQGTRVEAVLPLDSEHDHGADYDAGRGASNGAP